MTAKICYTCASAIGHTIKRVTLGRQCSRCKKTNENQELMIPIHEDALKPECQCHEVSEEWCPQHGDQQ